MELFGDGVAVEDGVAGDVEPAGGAGGNVGAGGGAGLGGGGARGNVGSAGGRGGGLDHLAVVGDGVGDGKHRFVAAAMSAEGDAGPDRVFVVLLDIGAGSRYTVGQVLRGIF